MSDERRPQDLAHESAGITAEAAGLAEHIRDTNPRWKREDLLDQLVEMIDDAHECSMKAHIELEETNE